MNSLVARGGQHNNPKLNQYLTNVLGLGYNGGASDVEKLSNYNHNYILFWFVFSMPLLILTDSRWRVTHSLGCCERDSNPRHTLRH